eukprot:6191533-Pleurochrysis_carterae.AAC.3
MTLPGPKKACLEGSEAAVKGSGAAVHAVGRFQSCHNFSEAEMKLRGQIKAMPSYSIQNALKCVYPSPDPTISTLHVHARAQRITGKPVPHLFRCLPPLHPCGLENDPLSNCIAAELKKGKRGKRKTPCDCTTVIGSNCCATGPPASSLVRIGVAISMNSSRCNLSPPATAKSNNKHRLLMAMDTHWPDAWHHALSPAPHAETRLARRRPALVCCSSEQLCRRRVDVQAWFVEMQSCFMTA